MLELFLQKDNFFVIFKMPSVGNEQMDNEHFVIVAFFYKYFVNVDVCVAVIVTVERYLLKELVGFNLNSLPVIGLERLV